MSEGGETRRRLRPWLEAKINSGTVPGLYWVDDEKTLFRVPWKHAGKQDWSPEQSTLFMEWAKHTGRYREGVDDPDYATWKTRLRCAFNKAPDIQEDKSKTDLDAAEPFRVYKFLPKKPTKRLPGLAQNSPVDPLKGVVKTELMDMAYIQQQSLNPRIPYMIERLNKGGNGEQAMSVSGSIPSDLKNIPSNDILRPTDGTAQLEQIKQEIADGEHSMDCVDGISAAASASSNGASTVLDNTPQFIDLSSLHESLPDDAQILPNTIQLEATDQTQWFAQQSPQSDQPDYLHQLMMSPASEPATSPTSTTQYIQQQQQYLELSTNHPEPSTSTQNQQTTQSAAAAMTYTAAAQYVLEGHEMHVTVQYLNHTVIDNWVCNSAGCRLYHGVDATIRSMAANNTMSEQLLGPDNMEQLPFPAAQGLLPTAQLENFAKQLLENMDRGLLLQCRNGDIYANRLCKCKIFVCSDQYGTNCIDLPRQESTKIFDFHGRFKQEFENFRQGGGPCPSAEVHIWFGQRSQTGASNKILISGKLISAKAALQLQTGENIDSSNSAAVSMCISASDDGDRLAHKLKEISDIVN